jgi:hypothetical protein
MPRFRVTGPDGKTFVVNAPEGATKEQAIAFARQHIAAPKKKERGILGTISDVAGGIADSATLGFADEIGAGIDTVTGLRDGGHDYQANLRNRRQTAANAGGGRLAGQILGGVALPMGKLGAAKGALGWLGTAAAGAGYGAAYGAGSADGGIKKRVEGAGEGALLGAGGGIVGRAAGAGVARVLRGKNVSPAVRKLADEGVVMTPGQRGGSVKRALEDGVLGSIPLVKNIPQAAKRRGIEQLNVATYNRVLKPLGAKLPMSTQPGQEAVASLGDTVYAAFDDAASGLVLGKDKGIEKAAAAIKGGAKRTAGPSADQLRAIVDDTMMQLESGPVSGKFVSGMLGDLRGEASQFARSPVANERRLGDQLWRLHDQLEAGLTRQNPGDVLGPLKSARESVSLLKRVEAAAAKSPDGIFNPQQLRTAVTKRGYGTTTGNVARGLAPLQDLADAAKQVLPNSVPNSGTPERMAGLAAMGGPGAIGAFVDPTMGAATALPMLGYVPGIDKILQDLALKRPDLFVRGGNAIDRASPYLGTAGAMTAVGQGR